MAYLQKQAKLAIHGDGPLRSRVGQVFGIFEAPVCCQPTTFLPWDHRNNDLTSPITMDPKHRYDASRLVLTPTKEIR
jgi:hypothetical protein